MSRFYGTHQNRLDAKGRVSVPASFRAALRDPAAPDAPITFIVRPSHKHACLEGWPVGRFDALSASMDRLPQFGDAHEAFATSVFSDAYPVESDKEGRISLTADMVEHAQLAGQVAFMGMGDIFQIWEPEACARHRKAARDAVRQLELPA